MCYFGMSGMRSNEFSWLKRKVSKYFQSACFHQQTFVLAIFDDFEKWTDIAFLGAMECSTCLLLVTPPLFSGSFVGAFPKIQTYIYCAWPVVH